MFYACLLNIFFYICINKQTKTNIMKATLNFQTIEQAEKFALAFSRKTLGGHIVSNTKVTVFNIGKDEKIFIDNYINKLNN